MSDINTEWFDIKNYQRFKDMPLEGWRNELRVRAYIKMLLEDVNDEDFASKFNKQYENKLKEVKNRISQLKQCVDFSSIKKYSYPAFSKQINDITQFNIFNTEITPQSVNTAVFPIPCSEIFEIYTHESMKDVWDSCYTYFHEDMEQVGLSNTALDKCLYERFRDVYLDYYARVMIDLEASDEQILSDFKQLLAEYRAVRKNEYDESFLAKTFNEKDMQRWHRYGVIPFIDLTLIAEYEKNTIPQHIAGSLLFPTETGIDFTERVRKVTKPMAMELMKYEILRAMDIQLKGKKE